LDKKPAKNRVGKGGGKSLGKEQWRRGTGRKKEEALLSRQRRKNLGQSIGRKAENPEKKLG